MMNSTADYSMNTRDGIECICRSISKVLVEKNRRYGDSAVAPVRIFSKAEKCEQLRVRLDDKLSRIANGEVLRKNDMADLIGYCVLMCHINGWHDFSELID